MIRRALGSSLMVAVAAFAMTGCGGNSQRGSRTGMMPRDSLQRSGILNLFDSRTLLGWHTYQQPRGVTTGWSVDDSAIYTAGDAHDLVSDLQFGSFDLTLEWKVAPGANSGIFIWANEGTQEIYENAPEMQVLDNAGAPDGKSPLTAAGSLYDLYPAPIDLVKPAGQWNQVRIEVRGSKVAYYLNGIKTVDVNFDSDEMKAKIAGSKFKQWLSFGKSRRGHIGLQSHGGKVWFRNIHIKDLS